jgi:hypothetical protein
VAAALADPLAPGELSGASFPVIPPIPSEGEDVHPAAVADSALAGFPTSGGTYAILSSGDATLAGDPDSSNSLTGENGDGKGTAAHGTGVHDMVQLRVDLNVPANGNCLSLDFRFLSEEYPEYVGKEFNDGFVAELDGSDFKATALGIEAARNFAFDGSGNVISVNTTGFAASEAAGTTYNGATPMLRALTPVTAGIHSVYVAVFDQKDAQYDSTAFIDNMRIRTVPAGSCAVGASSDLTPPDTIIDLGPSGSTVDSTPTFGFHSTEGKSTFECSIDTGTPAFAPCSSPHTSATLASGSYTFRVRAIDGSANTDPSPATREFTVLPPPRFGHTVNLHLVSGVVLVRLPGKKKFIPLTSDIQIPVGAVIDATNGRVSLTSAKSEHGGEQTADFYLGTFKVLQPAKGAPITVVKLVGPTSCPGGKKGDRPATASRKKGGGLWGNGHGNYRSVGKHGSATVRGTIWFTQDRCDGTFFRVKRGVVGIRDFTRHKTVTINAGSTYLAPAP